MSKKSLFNKACLMDILQLLPGAKGKGSRILLNFLLKIKHVKVEKMK